MISNHLKTHLQCDKVRKFNARLIMVKDVKKFRPHHFSPIFLLILRIVKFLCTFMRIKSFLPDVRIFPALCAFLLLIGCGHRVEPQPECVTALDDLIDKSEEFRIEKEMKIDNLRKKLTVATSVDEKFTLNSLLFDEFYTFNSDSAGKYIDASYAIAREQGNEDWITKSKLKKASFLSVTGMLTDAQLLLDSIRLSPLSDDLLVQYYGDMIYQNSHLGNYIGGEYNDFYARERLYKDSIMMVIKPDHPEYLWYKGLDVLGTDKSSAEVIKELENYLKSSSLNTPQDAKNAYILAKLYEQNGDINNFKKYMALSGSVDVKIANYSEISSLEELARLLYKEGKGDIYRAYKYLSYCQDKAISYPNRVKAVGLSEFMGNINSAYRERNESQQHTTTAFLIATCILAAVLIVAVVIIFRQVKSLKRKSRSLHESNETLNRNIEELNRTHEELNNANRRLTKLISDLKEKNDELKESNYVKEEYIGSIFSICSNYIDKLSELKKTIHLQVLHKKYAEIENETEDFDMRSELKEFYRSFDTIFLHIYPDFVNDFNSLLQEDKKIVPKDGELLNTELRIYALIRLGISDSVKIAEFLHCSPQTVYNNRFRVRNKAIVAKDKFVDAVRNLGSYVKSE